MALLQEMKTQDLSSRFDLDLSQLQENLKLRPKTVHVNIVRNDKQRNTKEKSVSLCVFVRIFCILYMSVLCLKFVFILCLYKKTADQYSSFKVSCPVFECMKLSPKLLHSEYKTQFFIDRSDCFFYFLILDHLQDLKQF